MSKLLSCDIEIHTSEASVKIMWSSKTFSDGSEHVQILNVPEVQEFMNRVSSDYKVHYEAVPVSAQHLVTLLLLGNAMNNLLEDYTYSFLNESSLLTIRSPMFMRQDRACTEGSPFSLDLYLRLLAEEFTFVEFYGEHSLVINDYDNVMLNDDAEEDTARLIAKTRNKDKELILVAPDRGAVGRVNSIADRLFSLYGVDVKVIFAVKTRNQYSGEITGTALNKDRLFSTSEERPKFEALNVEGSQVFVVDDICDGGRTFVPLAQCLKEEGLTDINLLTFYGIYPNKETKSMLDNLYNKVECLVDLRDYL